MGEHGFELRDGELVNSFRALGFRHGPSPTLEEYCHAGGLLSSSG
jgi:hypothetical protein